MLRYLAMGYAASTSRTARDGMIDLRSDTVTQPSPAMRRAMAEAEVGDDVFGEDPTVRALEERSAELLGSEAGLLVSSGTMGNLVGLMAHVPRGGEIIAGADTHIVLDEAANHAVATELPASQSVAAVDAGARASTDSAAVRISISSAAVSNQVVIDRDARAVVYQVIDTRTSQVVKQFPEEAVLRRRAYFHALDLTKEAPTRLRATDRRA